MEQLWHRFIENLAGRLGGPMSFRFVLQPLMAIILGVVDAIRDARAGKPAFLWTVLFRRTHRKELLQNAWQHVGRIFILALILDGLYQVFLLHAFYPLELLTVAFSLALIPYILVRGPLNRVLQSFRKTKPKLAFVEKQAEPPQPSRMRRAR